jgi:hypothetical protein
MSAIPSPSESLVEVSVSLNIPYEVVSISDAKLGIGTKTARNTEKINIMIVLSFFTILFTNDKYLPKPSSNNYIQKP